MGSLSSPGTGRARGLLAGVIILTVLPYPFVLLRLWSRRQTKTRLALNDYLMIAALLVTTGINLNTLLAIAYAGEGQHITAVTPSELTWYLKSTVGATLLWPTGTALIKLSILHFYKTIFFSFRRTVQASYAIAGLTILYWLATIITSFSICQPYAYNWDRAIDGHCGDTIAYYLSTAIVNLLIDVMVVILPLPAIWSLQMVTSRKVALTVIFALGFGICGVSILRCYGIATINQLDPTYDVVLESITTTIEPVLGIVSACLPIMQPVAVVLYSSRVVGSLRHLVSSMTNSQRHASLGDEESRDTAPENYDMPQYKKKPRHHLDDLTTSLRGDDGV